MILLSDEDFPNLFGDGKLLAVPVKTGINDGIFTEVVEGLKEGDKVVTGASANDSPAATSGANPFGGGGFQRGR